MSNQKHVLVAMSGGVDSSVTAGLLARAGYQCTGVFMCFGQPSAKDAAHKACCSPEDARDAKEVAQCLGIRFAVLNFQQDLEGIIDYFVHEYSQARTPNPCIMCNSRLKFGKLMEYASLIGADYVATGHYARTQIINGETALARGIDAKKDQSYVLFNIARENVSRVMLPLGGYQKPQVRQLAAEMKLPVHEKPESQEICFVGDDDYARLVAERMPELIKPGPIMDISGKKLGEHQGLFHYTIGQRRGLGIAMGEPYYVTRLDLEKNTVILGPRSQLQQNRLYADRVNWLVNDVPKEPFDAIVQIRYNHVGSAATVTPVLDENGLPSRVIVDFKDLVNAITPGQAAVFYGPDQNVLGGGWIESAHTR